MDYKLEVIMATATNANSNEKKDKTPNFKIPNINTDAIIDSYKKNLEILGLINKMSIEVCNGVTKLQGAFVKQMISEMGEIMKGSKPSETFSKLAELGHNNMVKAMGNGKQISDMISATNKDVSNMLSKRFKESVEEAKNIVNKKETTA
jgi:phasin family protein